MSNTNCKQAQAGLCMGLARQHLSLAGIQVSVSLVKPVLQGMLGAGQPLLQLDHILVSAVHSVLQLLHLQRLALRQLGPVGRAEVDIAGDAARIRCSGSPPHAAETLQLEGSRQSVSRLPRSPPLLCP